MIVFSLAVSVGHSCVSSLPDAVAVEVIQTVSDLNGQPLDGQTHGLKDKTVTHIFRMEGEKIVRFDIRDAL